jgi:hypothetical protein
MAENQNNSEQIMKPRGFREWIENFWYHYKWHSLIALFLVFTVTICSMQMCSKESYDVYVMYAGQNAISRSSTDGDISPYLTVVKSLRTKCDDYNGDGEVKVEFLNLYVPTNEQISEYEKLTGTDVDYALVNDNLSTMNDTMMYSEYYICFMSESRFLDYDSRNDGGTFVPIEKYTNQNKTYEYASPRGIYLCSTDFYSLPGICDLPEDTVVCIRTLSAVASHFNKSTNEENYRRSELVLKEILK